MSRAKQRSSKRKRESESESDSLTVRNDICTDLISILDSIAKDTYELPVYRLHEPSGTLTGPDGVVHTLVEKPFAKGNFGQVHAVEDDTKIVVKVIRIRDDKEKDQQIRRDNEAHAMRCTRNEMVIHSLLYCLTRKLSDYPDYPILPAIHFLGCAVENDRPETPSIVICGMERMGNSGTFKEFITRGAVCDVLRVFGEICDVLQVLQNAFKFMHRDLHSNNIMLQSDANGHIHPVLIDFGYSSIQVTKCSCQPPVALSVERCRKCKCYSIGALEKFVTDGGNMFGGHNAFNASLDLAILLLNCEMPNEMRKNHNLKHKRPANDDVTTALDHLIEKLKSRFSESMTKRVDKWKKMKKNVPHYAYALYDAELVKDKKNQKIIDLGTSPAKVKPFFHVWSPAEIDVVINV
jgi:serine/threonine protein kinase